MPESATTARDGMNEDTSGQGQEKATANPFMLAITMDKRVEMVAPIAAILLGALILYEGKGLRIGLIADPITSRGLPIAVGLLLMIGGVVQAVRQLRTWSELPGHLAPEEGQEDEKGYPVSWARCFGIILLSFLWDWLLKPLGFLIITPLYLFLSALVMGEREWGKIIAFSIVFSLASWIIFGPLLSIRFPLGPLSHLAHSLGLAR